MEYGGPLFINQDKVDLEVLDKIQIEAMHIVTGAKRLTSHDLLKKDTCWPDLSMRRELQELSILHKVIHKQYPPYLLNDLPYMSDGNSRLERRFKFNTPPYNYAFYRDSVIPSMIANWNKLPNDIRTNTSLKTFKYLFKEKFAPPKYPLYNCGSRLPQMSHTRIRLNFSNLNYHLFNHGLSDSPNCENCNVPETPIHYFMECTKYPTNLRNELITKAKAILTGPNRSDRNRIPLNTLLHGKKELPYSENVKLFEIIHSYIRKTGRNP